ncbi:MAG: beta-eliminating lyase-related protein [Pseudomonadota bacterium]
MFFASDNSGPVHPKVMAALAKANEGYALPYGNDDWTRRAVSAIRTTFEAPGAEVFLLTLGTAANSLALSAMAQPWDAIFCHDLAHIEEDECNAPEFYTGGAKLALVGGADAKIDPDALARRIEAAGSSVHGAQRGAVSITQVTERGTVYTLDELRSLIAIAKRFGCGVHMDGARFANAVAATGSTPAELSWRLGIDALSFGGTKNGLMGVEALVVFDPAHAARLALRRKRAAQLMSKHRYLAAQMVAYLEDDLWLEMAASANAAAQKFAHGLRAIADVELMHPVDANMIFAKWPGSTHLKLQQAGAQYYQLADGAEHERLPARLVCDWSASTENTELFLELLTQSEH